MGSIIENTSALEDHPRASSPNPSLISRDRIPCFNVDVKEVGSCSPSSPIHHQSSNINCMPSILENTSAIDDKSCTSTSIPIAPISRRFTKGKLKREGSSHLQIPKGSSTTRRSGKHPSWQTWHTATSSVKTQPIPIPKSLQFGPGNPVVHRNEFGNMKPRWIPPGKGGKLNTRVYPPLPNAAYELLHKPSRKFEHPLISKASALSIASWIDKVVETTESMPEASHPFPEADNELERAGAEKLAEATDTKSDAGRSASEEKSEYEFILGWDFPLYRNSRDDPVAELVKRGELIKVMFKCNDLFYCESPGRTREGRIPRALLLRVADKKPVDEMYWLLDRSVRAYTMDQVLSAMDGINQLSKTMELSNQENAVIGEDFFMAEVRDEYSRSIEAGVELEYCKVCNRSHIPPGPPITLAIRDTCGAYLPEWYSEDNWDTLNPWNDFRNIINTLVRDEEIRKGYNHKTAAGSKWDLRYHESDRGKWLHLNRREGWWKCKSGPDAPQVEKECRICHDSYSLKQPAELSYQEAEESQYQRFIDRLIEEGGKRDWAAVLGRIEEEGWPQFLGEPEREALDEAVVRDGEKEWVVRV